MHVLDQLLVFGVFKIDGGERAPAGANQVPVRRTSFAHHNAVVDEIIDLADRLRDHVMFGVVRAPILINKAYSAMRMCHLTADHDVVRFYKYIKRANFSHGAFW